MKTSTGLIIGSVAGVILLMLYMRKKATAEDMGAGGGGGGGAMNSQPVVINTVTTASPSPRPLTEFQKIAAAQPTTIASAPTGVTAQGVTKIGAPEAGTFRPNRASAGFASNFCGASMFMHS